MSSVKTLPGKLCDFWPKLPFTSIPDTWLLPRTSQVHTGLEFMICLYFLIPSRMVAW